MRYYLEQCLLSVEKALCGVCGEVFVVDNNSTDDSMPYLKSKFPWVRYIENDENVGFSRANNQAIREARGEYVLLLNPDTFIGERSLRECIEFMDKTPQAGMCGVGLMARLHQNLVEGYQLRLWLSARCLAWEHCFPKAVCLVGITCNISISTPSIL